MKDNHCLSYLRLLWKKHHRLEDLNNDYLFFTDVEAEKLNVEVLTDSAPGESPFPGLKMASFL